MQTNQTIRNCFFCDQKTANYSCPRCGHFYCSKVCYNSEKHLNCSEMFYKKCVEDELRLLSKEKDDELKKRTVDILKREYESLIDEEDEDELKERFNKIHLQDEHELWSNLNEEEKVNFKKLLKQNEIINLLPVDCWTPWYHKVKKAKCLIEELNDQSAMEANISQQTDLETNEFIKDIETCLNKSNFKIPELSLPIKKLNDLTKIIPSPYLKYTIINVLFSYCYLCRRFNNDHLLFASESFDLIHEISLLNRNKTMFTSTRQSVQFTIQLLINNKKTKTQFILILIDDLISILENENKIYLHIISDLIQLVKRHKQILKKRSKLVKDKQKENNHAESLSNETLESNVKNLNTLTKKLEYYLSYLNDNGDCLKEEINEIEIERLHMLKMEQSIDDRSNDKKDEIRIY